MKYTESGFRAGGDKHPTSMGQDFKECWAPAWPVIGEAFESAAAGQAAFLVNQRIFIDRHGDTASDRVGQLSQLGTCRRFHPVQAQAVIGAPGAGRQTSQTAELILLWQDQERVLKASPGTCVIGRDTDCDVMVQRPTTLRQHASFEWRLGKFVLRKHGSYISKEDENSREIFLRHEEFPLIGSGVISLDIPRARNASALLRFRSR